MRVRPNDNPEITSHCGEEQKGLELLKDVLAILEAAINSLGGKSPPNLEVRYIFWVAVFINRSASGYRHLRDLGQIDASKLLVRPILEATFYAAAAMKERGFLFRKAYSEWREDNKYAPSQNQSDENAANSALESLKLAFAKDHSDYPIICKKVTALDAAKAAGLEDVYEKAYRVYCQFTHGAMRGIMGDLDDPTDPSDTRFIVLSTLKMLELLQAHTEAAVPDLQRFEDQLSY